MRLRRWLVVLLGVVLVVGVVGVLTVRDGLANRNDLQVARAELDTARVSLAQGDVVAAAARLDTAAGLIADADARADRPWWWLSSQVPLAGRSLDIAAAVGDVAGEAVALAQAAVEHAAPLLGEGDDLDVQVTDGVIDLAFVADVQGRLDRVDPSGLAEALERLESTPSTWVPVQVRDGRNDALRLGRELLHTLEVGDGLVDALPRFLGAGGARRYFLAMQNPAELRGTGGLIGLWSVLTIDGGEFELTEPEVYGAIDIEGADVITDLPPVPTDWNYAARYGQAGGASFFASVNLDPDLPTVGPVLVDLYADRIGGRLDGVIAMDPLGLAALLELVGPIEVPEAVLVDDLPSAVQPHELPELTLVDLYYAVVEDQAPRKAYLKELAEVAFDAIFSGDWDALDMADRLGGTTGRRHLQLYSVHEDEQAAFERAGIAGQLIPRHEDDDLLAFTGINAAGNKADVHVAHRMSADFAVDLDGVRSATVAPSIENPLPTDGPAYVTGSLTPVSRGVGGRGPDGLTRTWVTLWAPEDVEFVAARDDDGESFRPSIDRIHGHRAFDHVLEVPSESTGGFAMEYRGPVELHRDGADLVYRLTLWRQAKAIPDHVELAVTGPEGWDVAEVRLEGGGEGTGMGVGGDGRPLAAEHDGTTVRVTGAMTRDAHLEIRWTRPLWDRFREWLGQPAF